MYFFLTCRGSRQQKRQWKKVGDVEDVQSVKKTKRHVNHSVAVTHIVLPTPELSPTSRHIQKSQGSCNHTWKLRWIDCTVFK